jgi:RimJ/RimL family protein N-acetyltransferase
VRADAASRRSNDETAIENLMPALAPTAQRTPPADTARLRLRELVEDDAAFILELVNDPSWLRYIGDKGVRDLVGARAYIDKGPRASYAQHGFGLWRVERLADGEAIGLCGLIKRETLDAVDIGFAFLPAHTGQGHGFEAANAVVQYARTVLRLPRLVAIVSPDNRASIRVLEKLGLQFQKTFKMSADAPDTALFACELT